MNKDLFSKATKAKVLQSGKPFFEELLTAIDEASEEIHLQIYTLSYDHIGKKVIHALIKAAGRGVEVFVLADAFGSLALPDHVVKDLRRYVHFRFFSPLFSFESLYIGRRLHHKVITIDGQLAFTGGVNIADRYYTEKQHIPWLDFMLKVEGPVCKELAFICKQIWQKKIWIRRKKFNFSGEAPVHVRIIRNDWIRGKREISKSYKKAIVEAEKSIYLIGAYFFPGSMIKRRLRQAAKRGVEVTILVSGVFDVPLLRDATSNIYKNLSKAGVKILEWDRSVMHGKAMIVDDKWMTLGSYNVNYLSDYRSIELNFEVEDPHCIQTFRRLLKKVGEHCRPLVVDTRFSLIVYLRGLFSSLFLKLIYLLFSNPYRLKKIKLF